MGLPSINIVFSRLGNTFINRSSKGIVAMILKDNLESGCKQYIYRSLSEVLAQDWTQENYLSLSLAFLGKPSKIIVIKIPAEEKTYTAALAILSSLRWNYLTIPAIVESETTDISAWIKEQRATFKRLFKAVLPKTEADDEGIINFATDTIKTSISEKVISCAGYTARIAGLLAGLPIDRSCTFYKLPEVLSCVCSIDQKAEVNAGKLVIVFDGEEYKLAHGVNSLTTTTDIKTYDFKKIKVIEGHDMYAEDIRCLFEDNYIGKMANNYDNKQLLVAAINAYHKELAPNVLSSEYPNSVELDKEETRKHLETQGIDTSTMTEVEILKQDTGSFVFIRSNIKFIDAIEDMTLTAFLE